MPQIIDAGNGEYITVVDNGDGGSTMYDSSGNVVATTNSEGDLEYDVEAIADLGVQLTDIEETLSITRDLVTNGNLTRVRGAEYSQMSDVQFEQVDALNLKLGNFPDAEEVRDLYRQNFYMAKAEQIERIAHGYSTGREVAENIRTDAEENDGEISATVERVGGEFAESDGVHEGDLHDAQSENVGLEDTPEGEEGAPASEGDTTPQT